MSWSDTAIRMIILILVLSSGCRVLAQGVLPTQTTLRASVIGPPGRQKLVMSADVLAGSIAASGGRVTFRVNGVAAETVQVVGHAVSAGHAVGSAEWVVTAAAGDYTISAAFQGSSNLGSSTSAAVKVRVPLLASAVLTAIVSDLDPAKALYTLRSLDDISSLSDRLFTRRVADGSLVASQSLSPTPNATTTLQSDLAFAFVPSTFLETDLTGNGTEDLLVGNASQGTIDTYWQQADGSRIPGVVLTVGGNPVSIVSTDFNGDGVPDVAVLSTIGGAVSIFLQSSSVPGAFGSPIAPVKVGRAPQSMVVADFDHDGLPDIAVTNFDDDTISILLNQPSNPGQLAVQSTIATGGGPYGLVTADLLGKGMADLAVSNYYDGTLSIFANQPGINLFTPVPVVAETGAGPAAITSCDLNSDGIADLAVVNSLEDTVSVFFGSRTSPGEYATQWLESNVRQPTNVTCQSIFGGVSAANLMIASADGDLSLLKMTVFGRFPQREVFPIASSISASQAVRASSSGAFEIAALDPSLRLLHFMNREWSVSGPVGDVDLTKATNHELIMSLAYDARTPAVLVSNVLIVNPSTSSSQVITFAPLPRITYGDPPIKLVATSTSKLPITFSVTCGQALLADDHVIITDAGRLCIQVNQAGNSSVNAASPVTQKLVVQRRPLLIQPNDSQRLFQSPNPLFNGTVTGLVHGDKVTTQYSSGATGETAPGVYTTFPIGIVGTLLDDQTSRKYDASSSVGTFTICPTAEALSHGLDLATTIASCSTAVIGAPMPSPVPVPPSPPINQPVAPQPVTPSPPPSNPAPSPTPFPVPLPLPISPIPSPAPTLPTPIPTQPIAPTLPIIPDPVSPGPITSVPPPVPIPVGTAPSAPTPSKPLPILPIIPIVPGPIGPVRTSLPGHVSISIGIRPILIPIPLFARRADRNLKGTIVHPESSIQIIQDGRRSSIPGLVSVAIVLDCYPSQGSKQTVLIEREEKIVGSVMMQAGSERRIKIPASSGDRTTLRARSIGSTSCPVTTSDEVFVENLPNLPLQVSNAVLKSMIPAVAPSLPMESVADLPAGLVIEAPVDLGSVKSSNDVRRELDIKAMEQSVQTDNTESANSSEERDRVRPSAGDSVVLLATTPELGTKACAYRVVRLRRKNGRITYIRKKPANCSLHGTRTHPRHGRVPRKHAKTESRDRTSQAKR